MRIGKYRITVFWKPEEQMYCVLPALLIDTSDGAWAVFWFCGGFEVNIA